MRKIKELRYNYILPADGYSEEYEVAKVGENGVLRIEEYQSQWEGDKWHYNIIYQDKIIKTFRPFWVELEITKD